MALDHTDVELIKASWEPVRMDITSAGALLFKQLFTKFPAYLELFPAFQDLDLERIQENRRLLRHAVTVINTVTYVVDSIGDDSKKSALEEALVGLVKRHLSRRIGFSEFSNLGTVLVDFICEIDRRTLPSHSSHDSEHATKRDGDSPDIHTSALAAAWTKLYRTILDIVEHEEALKQMESANRGDSGT